MSRKPSLWTRRQSVGLIAAGSALAALPTGLAAASQTQGFEDLQRAIDAIRLKVQPSRLHLARYNAGMDGKHVHLQAVVELTWPPGFRSRMFEARDEDPDLALNGLVDAISDEFKRVAG